MSWDFSDAPTDQGGVGDLIPDGTLAWALVKVKPHNIDQGLFLKTSRDKPENRYLDIELTIDQGDYVRRKVWAMIGLAGSEKWVAQGMSSIRHILEVGREITSFGPGPKYKLGQQNQQGEAIFEELDGLRCAIKIGVEAGTGTYKDKNVVRAYLSPNPQSNTHKEFLRLVAGDTAPKASAAPKATVGTAAPTWSGAAVAAPAMPAGTAANPAWGKPSTTSAPAQPAASGRAAWLGAGPPKTDDAGEDKKVPW
jgi:hypothetical protein